MRLPKTTNPIIMRENHPFATSVPESSQVLILGSFPGKESTQEKRENDWFYGANRNQFWKIIELVYDLKLPEKKDRQYLFEKAKIGITDIISSCERKDNSNSDKNLINKIYNTDILNLIKDRAINRILFTSKTVYKEFTANFDVPEGVELVVLPSPSPIYRRLSTSISRIPNSQTPHSR